MTDLQPLLLNATDSGGAANATKRIHAGLRSIGVDSQMLVRRKASDDQTILAPRNNLTKVVSRLRPVLDSLPLSLYDDVTEFSLDWAPDLLHRRVRRLDPDVVHLNWVAGGYMSVGSLDKFDRPLVWRLPDMWPLTGGCHYSDGCTRYQESCGQCPKLGSDRSWDVTRLTLQRKKRALDSADLTVVATSSWLASCAAESTLFEDTRIETIPNGLDTDRFRPVDPTVGRELFDLPTEKPLILFGSVSPLSNDRKGFDLLDGALSELSSADVGDAELVIFGATRPDDPPEFDFPIHYTGYLGDEQSLSLLYSAVDAMVVPSRYEGFGQTVTEAMACGTPVVAFDATGPADTVVHEETGYLAKPYDSGDLAAGIEWVLEDSERKRTLGSQARTRAVNQYHTTSVADQYLQLYRELSQSHSVGTVPD